MRFTVMVFALLVPSVSFAEEFRIGVWNIEKLSTRSKRGFPEWKGDKQVDPRTDAQLKKVANYIRDDLKADALMLIEIDDDGPDGTSLKPRSAQLDFIESELGDNWDYYLGRTGGDLRIGFLFNKNRIKLRKIVNLTANEFKVADEDVYDRDPLFVHISLLENGQPQNDFLFVGLHLKSQQKFVHNHMAAVAKLLGDLGSKTVREDLRLPTLSEENEIIVVGDMNDGAIERNGFKYMFDYFEGVGYDHLGPDSDAYDDTRVNGSKIDHIFVSKNMIGQIVKPNTFKVHGVPNSKRDNYRKTYSDHFPVTVEVSSQSDND
ncbi:endonuclease/exonuclease/phosphatase family protein [Gimesia panareensis]|uniref:endonuclease/exonuclease/phosphatase family protein n=1 Tax=Gimesia panareensis TaxID=2527978 RepID=UPI00118C3178|nr:endonuclease/exonuclease/phosphatase family protein [Gimesia panareensis]QDU50483.1 Endonuclease/Exonuclease/phosphatase family protein [Gimesia panareensis]